MSVVEFGQVLRHHGLNPVHTMTVRIDGEFVGNAWLEKGRHWQLPSGAGPAAWKVGRHRAVADFRKAVVRAYREARP